MKKLLHSFLICLGIIMISSQTFAQALDAPGMKLKPYVGATYNYKFTGITAGLDCEFYFSSTKLGIGTKNDTFTGYIVGTAPILIPASGEVSVNVAYPTGASTAAKVYLYLKVYDASNDAICENYNAVEIQPIVNNFDVLVTNDLTNTDAMSDICPDISDLKATVAPLPAYADNYYAGKTIMNFTFTRTGSLNNWNLDFDIQQIGTGDYTYSLDGGVNTTTVTGGATKTTVTNTSKNDVVVSGNTQTLQIVLNNVPGDRPEFTVTVTDATDIITSVSAKTTDPSVVEKVKIMPKIGAFE